MVLPTFKINEKGTNRTNTTEKAERNEIDFTKTSLFYLRFGGLAVTQFSDITDIIYMYRV